MFDYHVHTQYSADSAMPMRAACDRAVAAGLREIAFTEHLDYFYPNCELVFEFDYGEYAKEVEAVQPDYEGKLRILKGVEVGLHPAANERNKQFTGSHSFDFIIGSVHIADDADLHNGDYFLNKRPKEAVRLYFETVNQAVKAYPDFNVLGHLTLVKRYLHYVNLHWSEIDWTDYDDINADTFRCLIQSNRGIEVNLSGYRYKLDCTLPHLPLLRLYKEMGGEIVTVGTDAHIKEHVGAGLNIGYQLLEEAGFRYLTTFQGRQPSFQPLGRLTGK